MGGDKIRGSRRS